jgi:WD40 repeat protein
MANAPLRTALLLAAALLATEFGMPHAAALEPPGPDHKGPARVDRRGDPLPPGALTRLGCTRFRHGFRTDAVAFSPDGKLLASAGGGRGLVVWDAATGQELHVLLPTQLVFCVAFSPDSKLLAASDEEYRLSLWDAATGKRLRRLAGNGVTKAVAFSPDGTVLASGGNDQLVRLWDVAGGRELRQLYGHDGSVLSVAFTPSGRTVAAAGDSKAIHLWDVATGLSYSGLTGHQRPVRCLAISPANRWLASGGQDQTLRLWDWAAGKELRVLDRKHGEVVGVAFSGDGRLLASVNSDGTVRLWDSATGQELRQWQAHQQSPVLAFSPDGKTLVTGSHFDSALRFWDPATGQERRTDAGHQGFVSWVAFSPDGKTLFSGSRDRTVRRWDLASGTDTVLFAWQTKEPLAAFALSPDRKLFATTDDTGYQVCLWDNGPDRGPRLLGKGKHAAMILALAFSPDGKVLASGSGDGAVCLWDAPSGKELRHIPGPGDRVCSLSFSPDGKTLASGAEPLFQAMGRTVRLLDVATGQELRPLECREMIHQVCFSPNGRLLASTCGYFNGKLRLWEVGTGQELFALAPPKLCYAVAFSPDGRYLAGGGDDRGNAIHLEEVATGQEVRRWTSHQCGVRAVAFSPDGKVLATGGADSTVLLWDVGGPQSSRRRGAGLTPKELEARWADLASADAPRAHAALWDLAAAPAQTVPFLRERLRPVPVLDAAQRQQMKQWLADLDSERFEVRQRGVQELERLGEPAEPALRAVLNGKPAPEVRRQLEGLLEKRKEWTPERLRVVRAISALEQCGTPEARQHLQDLAAGAPEALLTREAKAALERLTRN